MTNTLKIENNKLVTFSFGNTNDLCIKSNIDEAFDLSHKINIEILMESQN